MGNKCIYEGLALAKARVGYFILPTTNPHKKSLLIPA